MECTLCGGQNQPLYTDEARSWRYDVCDTCALICRDSKSWLPLEKENEHYHLHQNHYEDLGYRAFLQPVVDVVEQLALLPSLEKRGLDFGCGPTPVLAKMLEDQGWSMDYHDPLFYPVMPAVNSQYTLITFTEVFEHLHEPRTVLKQLHEWLAPGGYLVIKTRLAPVREKFGDWYYRRDPTHIVFAQEKTFSYLAQTRAWDIVTVGEQLQILRRREI